ncbi:MAG: hypothetical protein K0R93_2355 [Anaerosolibacter sp.]|nr:hypothetical protein [Anaerosolibacter sp.]
MIILLNTMYACKQTRDTLKILLRHSFYYYSTYETHWYITMARVVRIITLAGKTSFCSLCKFVAQKNSSIFNR